MTEIQQLIFLGVAVVFVVLCVINISASIIKLMYQWAPIVVLLGGIALLCYTYSEEFRNDIKSINAKHIESTETQSGHSID